MKFTFRVKVARRAFKVDKEFSAKSVVTERTIQVSEAFGIGVDEEKRFPIFRDFTVEVNPGDVVYITGDSGSGKSVLLRELKERIAAEGCGEFGGVADLPEPSADEVLIEGVGRDSEEAVSTLSVTGLNEAFLMLRRYRELSDGQKYRYRVAKAVDSSGDAWIFDEFCSVLDRVTGRVVAFTVQKTARRLGKTLIVATTHTDLVEDLKPSVLVEKRFGVDVKVTYISDYTGRFGVECSLLRDVRVERGTIQDYERLEQFHYRAGRPRFIKHIFRAVLGEEVIGCIVYGSCQPYLKPRSLALPEARRGDVKSTVEWLNQNMLRIWRVVVTPKYRSIGLGVKLVKDTLPLTAVSYVETCAVMARYNPFFERAGMLKVPAASYRRYDKAYEGFLEWLSSLGFNLQLLQSSTYTVNVLKNLPGEVVKKIAKTISAKSSGHFTRIRAVAVERGMRGEIDAVAEMMRAFIRLPYVYLIWKNPKFHDSPDPRIPLGPVH